MEVEQKPRKRKTVWEKKRRKGTDLIRTKTGKTSCLAFCPKPRWTGQLILGPRLEVGNQRTHLQGIKDFNSEMNLSKEGRLTSLSLMTSLTLRI